ncbi:hypothetical protein BCR44DRAFT_1443054, partial [Catenaria anguillulae PL171]
VVAESVGQRQQRQASLKPLGRTLANSHYNRSRVQQHTVLTAAPMLSKSPSSVTILTLSTPPSLPSSSSPPQAQTMPARPPPATAPSKSSPPPISAQDIRLVHSISTRIISFCIGLTGLLFHCLLPEREPGVTHARAMRKLIALLAVSAGSMVGVIGAIGIVTWKGRNQSGRQSAANKTARQWMQVSLWDAPSPGMVIGAMVLNSAFGYMVNL